MKVSELIELLSHEDQNALVVMARDPEGNGYSRLHSAWFGKYKDGEVGLAGLTADDVAAGYTEEDVMRGGKRAVVLMPE